jgi:DNA-directed RNA polymerase specialized sigma24 family protein
MSQQEAATTLGCALGTIGSRLNRAFVHLRRLLETDHDD